MSVHSERVLKELTAFELKLPQVFDLKPAYEIALPANRKLLVYDTNVETRGRDEDGKFISTDKPGWRTVIMTKRGTFINNDRFGRNEGQVFTDPLLLCLYAQTLSVEYAKKKKTTVEETDLDD